MAKLFQTRIKTKNTHNSTIRSDEALTLETSAFQIFHGGNLTFINTFDHRQPKLAVPFVDFVWEINFELKNAKVSCKCRNKVHLPLRTVVLIFSVQSECKLSPLEAGLWLTNFCDVVSCHFPS